MESLGTLVTISNHLHKREVDKTIRIKIVKVNNKGLFDNYLAYSEIRVKILFGLISYWKTHKYIGSWNNQTRCIDYFQKKGFTFKI